MNDIFNIPEETSNPSSSLTERELDLIILKMGSFLSIAQNKKINQTKLLIHLLENKYFKECFLRISDIESIQILISSIIERYPMLCKSKVVFNSLKRIYGNSTKRSREKAL